MQWLFGGLDRNEEAVNKERRAFRILSMILCRRSAILLKTAI
jgi:hypothetical protein